MLPEFVALTERAVEVARFGLPVFPLWWPRNGGCSCRAGLDCRQPGKHPRILGWQTEATTNEAKIRQWWMRWPTANIGIAMGRHADLAMPGTLVLDVDAAAGGFESLAALEAAHAPLPETVQVLTGRSDLDGRRGLHIYFKHPGIPIGNSVKKLGPGLDIRGDGGLVVGPGSVHASSLQYEWEVAHHPDETPFADPPSWLLDLVVLAARPIPVTGPTEWTEPDGLPAIADRIRKAQAWLAQREPAVEGQNGSAYTMGICAVITRGFALERDEDAQEALAEWNARCSPPWDDRAEAPAADSLLRKIHEGRTKGHIIGIGDKLFPPRCVFFGGQVTEAAITEEPGFPDGDGEPTQPRIKILAVTGTAGELVQLVRASEFALRNQQIYSFGGNLVTVRTGESGPSLLLTPKDTLRMMVNEVLGFAKPNGKEYRECYPPDEVIGALLSKGYWNLPEITGIIEAPTLRPDGSILDRPGFDAQTGLMFVSGPCDWEPVPESPSQEQLVEAFWWLGEPFRDFPFEAAHHKAAAIAALITAVIRPAIAGPVPMFLFDATAPGTGKGLLANVITMVATGRRASVIPPVSDEEEMRKLLTTLAIEGARMAIFDNVAKPLGGPALEASVTSGRWKDRVMGGNRSFDGPLRPFWGATGNNIQPKGDMPRRVVSVRMAADVEDPESRQGFTHPHLLRWVGENRAKLVAAALMVVRAYLAAGKPRPADLKPMGSFEDWDDLVRGALIWQGAPDVLTGRSVAQQDPDVAAFRTVLEAWHAAFRQDACTLQWIKRATESPTDANVAALRDALVELAPTRDGKDWDAGRVRYLFRRYHGRMFGQYCLVAGERGSQGMRWKVATTA